MSPLAFDLGAVPIGGWEKILVGCVVGGGGWQGCMQIADKI